MRTILLIGGPGSTLGSRLIERLSGDEGALIATWHSSDPGEQERNGCLFRRLDITRPDEVTAVVDEAVARFGGIDILINNAAVSAGGMVALTSLDSWRRVQEINLDGVFTTCRVVSRRMQRRGRGQIINIASLRAFTGDPGSAAYAASKAAVVALTKCLASELAPRGIAVNAVCPGYIGSKLNQSDPRTAEAEAGRALLDTASNLNDAAEFIHFMCSGRLRAVTGQVFHIDSRIH